MRMQEALSKVNITIKKLVLVPAVVAAFGRSQTESLELSPRQCLMFLVSEESLEQRVNQAVAVILGNDITPLL